MPELHLLLLPFPIAVVPVGGAIALGLGVWLSVARWPGHSGWADWVRRERVRRMNPPAPPPSAALLLGWVGHKLPPPIRSTLDTALRRSGSSADPEPYLGALVLGLAVIALACGTASALGAVPATASAAAVLLLPMAICWRLYRGGAARRQAVAAQLPMLVDLMALEQSGGGVGARRAMELVVARSSGPAADILRECLSKSATPGSPPLDAQIELAARATGLQGIAALGVVVRLQRLEGISTGTPLGNLARSLRDRQRDALTAEGRRALVTMLLPVAGCILLPFVLIVLYPALDRLSQVFS